MFQSASSKQAGLGFLSLRTFASLLLRFASEDHFGSSVAIRRTLGSYPRDSFCRQEFVEVGSFFKENSISEFITAGAEGDD